MGYRRGSVALGLFKSVVMSTTTVGSALSMSMSMSMTSALLRMIMWVIAAASLLMFTVVAIVAVVAVVAAGAG